MRINNIYEPLLFINFLPISSPIYFYKIKTLQTMSFANETPINVNATSQKAIQNFLVGDKIFAAGYDNASQWSEQTVKFSAGTSDDSESVMVYIRFMEQNNEGEIIVTPDQPFLLSTKEIKRANRLIPGVDLLLSATGSTLQILDLHIGGYRGRVHNVAINGSHKGDWIVAAGIICGDYTIELYQPK